MRRRIFGAVIAIAFPMHATFAGAHHQATDQALIPPMTGSMAIGDTTVRLDDVIERRSQELEDPPLSGTDRRVVHDARRGIRRITVELAMLGRERGDASILAGFQAIRLDATMRSIDRLLQSLARPDTLIGEPPRTLPEADRVAAIDRLDAFNRTGLDLLRRSDTGTVEALDATLAMILAPLRDVFGLLSGRPLESRWPIGSESSALIGVATADAATPSIDARVRTMLDAVDIDQPDAPFDVTILERVLSASPFDPKDSESTATWRCAAELLDCLQSGGDDERPLATSTLRPVWRAAVARRRTALRDLQRTLVTQDESASPSLSEEDLVAVRRSTRTSRAVRDLDEIAIGLARMHPAATQKAERLVASRARMLKSPRERDRTLAWIDRIIDDLDRYEMVDFESRLRTLDPPTIELVGGRTIELAAGMASTRRAWVEAITDEDTDGPAIDAMDRMARLGTLLADLLPLTPIDDAPILDLDRCDRWGGWYVDAQTLGWSTRTLLPGVRLAVGTAIAGDPDRFERELTSLESQSPLIRLAAAVARRTEVAMALLPGGGVATIAAASIPPTPSAWGVDHRIALAAACLGMAELVAIRADPAFDDAVGIKTREALADAVAAACETLLEDWKADASVGKETRP